MDELISVIVPVYNVEAYLDQCVESIAVQTYANLEIILVDDNSQDHSGQLCDRWSEKDARIKVIHITEPTRGIGPSRARNAGLDMAMGDYIGFVDGDDWIEPVMFERLFSALKTSSSDLAICGIVHEWPQKKILRSFDEKACLNGKTALQMLIDDKKIQNFSWDKLYRRELFSSLRFPVGKIFEDVLIQYRFFELCSKVTVIPDILYHYRRRGDSIIGSFQYPQRLAFCMAHQERWEDLAKRHPALLPHLAAKYLAVVELVARGMAALELESVEKEAGNVSRAIAPFWTRHRDELIQFSESEEHVLRLERFLNSPVIDVATRKMAIADSNAKKKIIELQKENAELKQALQSASDQKQALETDIIRLKTTCEGMKKALKSQRRVNILKKKY